MTLKRICVDMDEVIADAVAEHLLRYDRDHDDTITKDDLHGKWLWDVVSVDRHPALEEYLRSEDFCGAGGDAGVAAGAEGAATEVRGVYRDGCDGGADIVCGEVQVAGAALPFYSVVAHCVLRGQGDSAADI